MGVMSALAAHRPLFHSEADFQHAFAWELQRSHPAWAIRLEVPVRGPFGAIHIDLLAISDDVEVAIELKYKTRKLSLAVSGEQFALADQAAQDLGRYDFCRDVNRIEEFAHSSPHREGYALFLTNDSAYWKAPGSITHGYACFAMNEGRNLSGELLWGEAASEGTRRGRENGITLRGSYCLRWQQYSISDVKSHGEFRYLGVRAGAA
jgi:hypothetical protein